MLTRSTSDILRHSRSPFSYRSPCSALLLKAVRACVALGICASAVLGPYYLSRRSSGRKSSVWLATSMVLFGLTLGAFLAPIGAALWCWATWYQAKLTRTNIRHVEDIF